MSKSPTIPLEDFANAAFTAGTGTRPARLAGLDVGSKTIGIAISDSLRTIATGLETIRRSKFKNDAARLLEIADEYQIAAFVIGLPLNMDGSEGPRVQSTEAFARNLAALTDLPLIFWDERLSTKAAERTLLAADRSRDRRKQLIDKMAAAYILQGALDRLDVIERSATARPASDDGKEAKGQ